MAYAVFPVLLCLETERILINFIVPLSGRKILVWQKGIVYNKEYTHSIARACQ